MPEPGEVREGLVWTGTEWVPLKPSPPEESPEDRKPDSLPNDGRTGILCPQCHESAQLLKVSGLLDKSKTSATSYTFGTGIGVGTGGIGVGVGDAVTDTQGTTVLAERFKLPSPTIYGGCWISGITFVVLMVLVGILSLFGLAGGNVASVVALIPILFAVYWYWKYVRFEKAWRKINEVALNQVRSGYYCQRCDVAVRVDADVAQEPEDYVAQIVAEHRHEVVAAAAQVPLLNRFFRL